MSETQVKPRVCACVMMNHPFPGNIPLLRKIYADRFSTLRFLIPFERMPDEDVITVYRGSYTHAGYLADAHHILSQIECDYYLVIHDDVLLTPRLSEDTFRNYLPLGPDDGFIPGVGPTPDEVKVWGWMFGMVPKLLFPKSQLFGSGIELASLLRYLPSADRLLPAMAEAGVTPTTRLRFNPNAPDDAYSTPSRFLLHGLAGGIPIDLERHQNVERECITAETALVRAMLNALRLPPLNIASPDADVIDLPMPLVTAGYATDLYVLPKSGFDDFCHYVGVASAANLFVEIAAPTLLFAACQKVWTAGELGLDFSGFDERKKLAWFAEDRAMAMHPYKLSVLSRPDLQEDFLTILEAIRDKEPLAGAVASAFFGTTLAEEHVEGWHAPHGWGVWAATERAVIPVRMPQAGPLRLTLSAPIDGTVIPSLSGRLVVDGAVDIPFEAVHPAHTITVDVPWIQPGSDGVARVTLVTDRLICPQDIDPAATDTRRLGMAVVSIERPPVHQMN